MLNVSENGETIKKVVDWRRYLIGFTVNGADKELGGIQLSRTELRILKLLLTKPIGGDLAAGDDHNPGLCKLLQIISNMESYMAERGLE